MLTIVKYSVLFHHNTRFKLIKWWAQSFLIGIPRIVCGFRDDNGVVQTLQNYPVHEIPGIVKVSFLVRRELLKVSVCVVRIVV